MRPTNPTTGPPFAHSGRGAGSSRSTGAQTTRSRSPGAPAPAPPPSPATARPWAHHANRVSRSKRDWRRHGRRAQSGRVGGPRSFARARVRRRDLGGRARGSRAAAAAHRGVRSLARTGRPRARLRHRRRPACGAARRTSAWASTSSSSRRARARCSRLRSVSDAVLVAIDTSYAARGPSGTGVYIEQLVAALRGEGVEVVELRQRARLRRGGRNKLRSGANAALDLAWTRELLPRAAARAGAELLHHPLAANARAGVPQVVTIHDVAFATRPPDFARVWRRIALR